MKKKLLSVLMAMVMMFSLIPTSVFAADVTEEASAAACATEGCILLGEHAEHQFSQDGDADTPAEGDEGIPAEGDEGIPAEGDEGIPAEGDEGIPTEGDAVGCAEDCILAEGHEGGCAGCVEGCILTGDPDHKGEECFVEMPCTLTEGCELIAGHPGECTGAATLDNNSYPVHFFLGSPNNIVNPNGQYTNYYVGTASDSIDNLKSNSAFNTLFTAQGIRNNSNEDYVVSFIKTWPEGKSREEFETFSTVYIGGQAYSGSQYEIQWVTVCFRDPGSRDASVNCNCRVDYEHVHVDGLVVKKVVPGTMEIHKAIPEAAQESTTFTFTLEKMAQATITSAPQNALDPNFNPITLSATIPKGSKEALIEGGQNITFGYYRLTENSNINWMTDKIDFDPKSGSDFSRSTGTLYVYIAPNGTVQYCDTLNGTYREMNKVTIHNKRAPLSVAYEWRLYDGSGNHVAMPADITPPLPETETNVAYGSNYVYDTEYDVGTSFIDPQNGKMYSFHGWDTYSHSDLFNVVPMTGYTALDDGDQNPNNNKTVPMTADTYIYGYWTVSDLPPASAHIAVEKVFKLEGVDVTANLANTPIASAAALWFRIDPGIDKNNDGVSRVDIEYPAILAQNGEYKLPVYQYDTDFKFTEHDADVLGYTRTPPLR